MCQISMTSELFNSENNLGLRGRKYFTNYHIFFLTLNWRSAYVKYWMCQISIDPSIFNFGANLGLTNGKYFIKISFDFKIEICLFEISNVPSFQKI